MLVRLDIDSRFAHNFMGHPLRQRIQPLIRDLVKTANANDLLIFMAKCCASGTARRYRDLAKIVRNGEWDYGKSSIRVTDDAYSVLFPDGQHRAVLLYSIGAPVVAEWVGQDVPALHRATKPLDEYNDQVNECGAKLSLANSQTTNISTPAFAAERNTFHQPGTTHGSRSASQG